MNVFCLHGAEPEVQAYALAKYSRSSSPMIQTIQELNSQKAEDFLSTFYFQYGHRSIADLAHVPMVMEDISMLAAIEVVDEQRWDGQERSTRYQDFSERRYFIPEGMTNAETVLYHDAVNQLFEAYDFTTATVAERYRALHAAPEGMKPEAVERTIMARTFDVSRYLLPLATTTAVGQITSARSLEGQISRLLSSPVAELTTLAEAMRSAAREPAFNVFDPTAFRTEGPSTHPKVAVSPSLVKYAEPNIYQIETRKKLSHYVQKVMGSQPIRKANRVSCVEFNSLEEEIVCSLLYEVSNYPIRQIRTEVRNLPTETKDAILALGVEHRGSHDELLRPYRAGYGFTFDIYIDIGGFRDMHRHRRCIQIIQDYNFDKVELPDFPDGSSAVSQAYSAVIKETQKVYRQLRRIRHNDNPIENYIIPLGAKKRMLMKMDFAELMYIAELRTGPAGHISYRKVAGDMFAAAAKKHPLLVRGARVHDVSAKLDFFKR